MPWSKLALESQPNVSWPLTPTLEYPFAVPLGWTQLVSMWILGDRLSVCRADPKCDQLQRVWEFDATDYSRPECSADERWFMTLNIATNVVKLFNVVTRETCTVNGPEQCAHCEFNFFTWNITNRGHIVVAHTLGHHIEWYHRTTDGTWQREELPRMVHYIPRYIIAAHQWYPRSHVTESIARYVPINGIVDIIVSHLDKVEWWGTVPQDREDVYVVES